MEGTMSDVEADERVIDVYLGRSSRRQAETSAARKGQ
jgi:hypothetical protein